MIMMIMIIIWFKVIFSSDKHTHTIIMVWVDLQEIHIIIIIVCDSNQFQIRIFFVHNSLHSWWLWKKMKINSDWQEILFFFFNFFLYIFAIFIHFTFFYFTFINENRKKNSVNIRKYLIQRFEYWCHNFLCVCVDVGVRYPYDISVYNKTHTQILQCWW